MCRVSRGKVLGEYVDNNAEYVTFVSNPTKELDMSLKITTDEFIRRARLKHGNKYDYSKVEYVNAKTKVEIICPVHGSFFLKANNHTSVLKRGCARCAIERNSNKKRRSTEGFIRLAKKIHGDKYDYSKVEYLSAHEPVTIICPIHGEFTQSANNHIKKEPYGCWECGVIERSDTQTSNVNEFIAKAKEIHGNTYIYCDVEYVNAKTKVDIICRKHGTFEQDPDKHLNGQGCQHCGYEENSRKQRHTTEEFIEKAICAHAWKYNYKLVDYDGDAKKVKIICPEHGVFEQGAGSHISTKRKRGCPKCSHIVSKQEVEVKDFLKTFYDGEIILNNRGLLGGKEIDIYLPEAKLAIEFNGLYWHVEQQGKNRMYHLEKTEKCESKGIQLLHIFSNEWEDKRDIWESVIKVKAGHVDHKIGARKTEVRIVQTEEATRFCIANHLQGAIGASVKLGLYYSGELVSLMTFGKSRYNKKFKWELLRFCSRANTLVMGGASKLLKHFRQDHDGTLITFANRRWSDGGLYKALGFKHTHNSIPNYFYTDDFKSLKSRVQFQKHKLMEKLDIFDPEKSEYENCLVNGLDRIWDCGNKVYCDTLI